MCGTKAGGEAGGKFLHAQSTTEPGLLHQGDQEGRERLLFN